MMAGLNGVLSALAKPQRKLTVMLTSLTAWRVRCGGNVLAQQSELGRIDWLDRQVELPFSLRLEYMQPVGE